MPDLWVLAEVAAKWALYVGLLGAAGTLCATLVFKFEDTRRLTLQFAALGLVAALLVFSLKGANLAGDASGMIDPEMLGLLWGTSVGSALSYRVIGLLLVLAGLFLGALGQWVSLIGGLLGLWSFAQVGHVFGLESVVLSAVLMAHLIAVSFWIGVLTPLKRLASDPLSIAKAGAVGQKFGEIASIAVPVVLLAGGYMAYVLVGSFTLLITTSYGQILIAKLLLVGVLLSLAAFNKLRLTPALNAGHALAAARLARSISLEWICVLGILGVSAALTSSVTLPM